jgi:hypothetical protein
MKSNESVAVDATGQEGDFLREVAKEVAVKAIQNKYPVAPEPMIRLAIKRIDRIDRKLPKLKRKGIKR